MLPILFLFSLLTVAFSAKDGISEASLEGGSYSTTSDYRSKAIRVTGAHASVIPAVRFAEGSVSGNEFQSLSAGLGYKFSQFASAPSLSIGVFKREFGNSRSSVPVALVRGELQSEKTFMIYQLGYQTMSEEFQTAYTVGQILRGSNIQASGSYRFHPVWRSTFFLQNFIFNDSNVRTNADTGILYGISPGDPWIWVGAGGGRLSNSKTSTSYWTPKEFFTMGPRLEVALTLLRHLKFSSGFNLNYFRDIEAGAGVGYYTLSKLTYELSKTISVFASYEKIQTEQSGKLWSSQGINFGLKGVF